MEWKRPFWARSALDICALFCYNNEAICRVSSSGRATASQAVGGGFESRILLQKKPNVSRIHSAFLQILADGGAEVEDLYRQLAALAQKYGAQKLVLFGSRARGDNRCNSDIDLAVYGMPPSNRAGFWLDCEELPTLLKFDIVHMTNGMDPVFLANIQKDGVTLYAAKD